MATILVVDDERDVVQCMAIYLECEGFQVLRAYDGVEALEIVRATPPDVVALDVVMPKLSGLDVLREMQADPATAHIPVVMLSAISARPERIAATLDLGAIFYMTKPFEVDELVLILKRIVASPRAAEV